jgi:hypothetical protein
MKTRLFVLSSITLAAILMLLTGQRPVVGQGTHGGDKFEGTWLNDVKLVTCAPAPPAVIRTLQSMTTYMRGGILIEGGGPATPPPAVSRSAGHGIWERTGEQTFRVFFRFHSFDNLGRLVRIAEVTNHVTLINGDNPDTPDVLEPYYLSGSGTSQATNINPLDGTVINVIAGCQEATSRPILFEP